MMDPGDAEVADSLIAGLVGERVSAWRKGYRRTGNLHFGELRQLEPAKTKRVFDDAGKWVLQLWSCTVRLGDGPQSPARVLNDEESFKEALARLVGETVSGARVMPDTWQLRISFEGEQELLLEGDPTYEEDEQWNLWRPDGDIIVFWNDRWGLRPGDE